MEELTVKKPGIVKIIRKFVRTNMEHAPELVKTA
jgi:hypothetical protein